MLISAALSHHILEKIIVARVTAPAANRHTKVSQMDTRLWKFSPRCSAQIPDRGGCHRRKVKL